MSTQQYTYTEMASLAYTAYGDSAHWKNHLDRPMPFWDDLPEAIHQHWIAAVMAIVQNLAI